MNEKSEKLKKIFKANFFRKAAIKAAYHPLFSSFLFLFIALLIGGFLFYRYVLLAQRMDFKDISPEPLLKEDVYNEVFKAWQEQEENFKAADAKEYPNPFKKNIQPTPAPKPAVSPTPTISPTPVSS